MISETQSKQLAVAKVHSIENEFDRFTKHVNRSFQALAKDGQAFVVDISGDTLWGLYLAAFPEGTNPIFKKNTEHDCSCCRHFIKHVGTIVSVDGDLVRTVWDEAAHMPGVYGIVASSLRAAILKADIALFPDLLLGITGDLHFARVFDLLVVLALMVLTVVIFMNYFAQKELRKKLEKYVRQSAIDETIKRKQK